MVNIVYRTTQRHENFRNGYAEAKIWELETDWCNDSYLRLQLSLGCGLGGYVIILFSLFTLHVLEFYIENGFE